MTMIAITIIISMSVKPRDRVLPLRIRSSIRRLVHALRVNIENVLPAPAHAGRVVLHTPHAPFARIRHRVDRNPPQKLDLCIRRLTRPLHAVHQRVERFGITIRVQLLDPQLSRIGHVFVLVDRRVNLVQRFSQLPLLETPHVPARHRHRHARQHKQNRERHDQLDERHARLWPVSSPHFTFTTSGGGTVALIACPVDAVIETEDVVTVVFPRPTAWNTTVNNPPAPEIPPSFGPRLTDMSACPLSFRMFFDGSIAAIFRCGKSPATMLLMRRMRGSYRNCAAAEIRSVTLSA